MKAAVKLQRLLRNQGQVNWALADQAMVSGANVLTGILLARFLGLDGFGTYTLAWAVLLLVSAVHLPLIVGSMMSIGPKQTDADAPAYFGAVVIQNLAFSVFGAVLVFAGATLSGQLFPDWDVGRAAMPLGVATFSVVWQEFFRRYYYTRGRPAVAFVLDGFRYGGQIGVLLVLFFGFPGLLDSASALWVVAAAAAIPALLSMLWLGAIEFRWSVMGPVARRHFRSAKWMVVSEPIEWASEYVFIFATGTLLGPVAVGALRASQNIAGMTSILFLGLLNVVPSKASAHFHTGGLQAMNRYLRRITLAGTPVTAGICLVIAASPDFWLGLLFGSEFVGYGELVRWWALFYTINFFVLPLRSGLRALERTRPVFVARLGSAAFAVLTAGVLISSFELRGAVIGLLATKVITVGLLGWLYRATQRELAAGDLKLSAAGS